jgi:hypothetical protein
MTTKIPRDILNSPSVAKQAHYVMGLIDRPAPKSGSRSSGARDQPRVPKGSPDGGEWTSEDGGAAGDFEDGSRAQSGFIQNAAYQTTKKSRPSKAQSPDQAKPAFSKEAEGLAKRWPLKGRLSAEQMAELVHASNHSGLPDELVIAQIWQESRFNPTVVSPSGEKNNHPTGLMQVKPKTFEDLKKNHPGLFDGITPNMLTDPAVNILAGTTYMADLMNQRGGSYKRALNEFGTKDIFANKFRNAAAALKRNPDKAIQILHDHVGN